MTAGGMYWLFKSEPETWSWDEQRRAGKRGTEWDGVRNHQANNMMKRMGKGDLGFFYHSGGERRIVGVVRVVRTHYPDHTDLSGRFGMVDVAAVCSFAQPVSLAEIKEDAALSEMVLVRQSRLSVQPVTAAQWRHICRMGGVAP